MVLKKSIYYRGFHDLLPPVIPKAPRSLRKRSLHKKSSKDGEICAFDLLATVADKLLQEHEIESSTSSTGSKGNQQIEQHEVKVKVKPVVSSLVSQPTVLDHSLKEFPHFENDSGSDHASIVIDADFNKKVNTNLIMEAIEDKPDIISEIQSVGLTSVKTYSLKDRLDPCVNTRVPNKSSSSVRLSFCKDQFHSACFPRRRGNVNVIIRDDDEKYFRYNNRGITRLRAFRSRSRVGYKRMMKMMPSRYWKVARKLNDFELPNSTSGGVKSFYHKRKTINVRERFQSDSISKKRKLFHQTSRSPYVKKISSETVSNLVKFSIKSFKVPDLYVEVPETATVGSLKRSVMEAVTAILHGNLHVGVIVQGKKVRDDTTLQQSEISENCNFERLRFTLEPEDSSFLAQQETPSCNIQQQLLRSPSIPNNNVDFSYSSPNATFPTTMENNVEKNEVSTTIEAEGTTKEPTEDSKALVIVPAIDAEIISVVPLTENQTKRYEFSQRRIRRPFSVSEVEALVEAVETLGAGRWRDVKIRAFDGASHRTYVDLKDKWKTLVHTATISPQQRRGEPVPQDLLDRVLAAHAYWSQHQHAKKHQKNLEAQM